MSTQKNILITGITGQIGSYLADLLLEKGHNIYGLVRRISTPNTQNINHILDKINLVYGDLTDQNSLYDAIQKSCPHTIYNCAAQSLVPYSWDCPISTADITGLGVARLLYCIRDIDKNIRFVQLSSSEMWGLSKEVPQKETTPFYPRSPYACAKAFGYHTVVNVRESYGIFAANAICFNCESIPGHSPIIIKDNNNNIDILPIEDMFRTDSHKYEGLLDKYHNKLVWNGENWTKILSGTCYQSNKKIKVVQTRRGLYAATDDHVAFNKNNEEVLTKDFKIGDMVFKTKYPEFNPNKFNDLELARFIGFIIGDGYISDGGRIRLIGCDKELLIDIANLVCEKFSWSYNLRNNGPGNFSTSKKDVWHLDINNDLNFGLWLSKHIYTLRSEYKRIPMFILNANDDIKMAMYEGYYLADGRKAGHERYKYKGFSSNSQVLSLGLSIISKQVLKQEPKTKLNTRDGLLLFETQLRSATTINHPVWKELDEVIKIYDIDNKNGWLYDLQTESETFASGSNLFKIHNSPRRGIEFVTRKIVDGAIQIKLGLSQKLKLGNLSAQRDWGYAKDYVDCIVRIGEHSEPDDFIIASGKTNSIETFCRKTFNYLDLDYTKYVETDPSFIRPAEVPLLLGDAGKAKNVLGWAPTTDLDTLIKIMVDSDYKKYTQQK